MRAFPGTWMRGGTSKGLFVLAADLPSDPAARDALLLAALGSPDPYGRQIDGLGGATSSTSKVVIVAPASRPDCDVDYHFGAVAIEQALIDWSGNCGNLTAAVGPFAIHAGLLRPADGIAVIRLWQAGAGERIVARVPVAQGLPLEDGDCELDGVARPGAPIELTFGGSAGELLPTGRAIDTLQVPGHGPVRATLLYAGNPAVIAAAADFGLAGTETAAQLGANAALLERLEALRAAGAVAMRLAASIDEASRLRPATPKVALVGPPAEHVVASGRRVSATDVDFVARMLSMGAPHHAITSTGSLALAAAAVLPGSVVQVLVGELGRGTVRIGHASGVVQVGARLERLDDTWRLASATVTRTARRLMTGTVFAPESAGCC